MNIYIYIFDIINVMYICTLAAYMKRQRETLNSIAMNTSCMENFCGLNSFADC